jgi:ABC-type dipeptide/oligopeptide/nickel transport system permease subunit
MGTDYLGRDVLSRFFLGGRTMPAVALASTAVAFLVGGTAGLIFGFVRGAVDGIAVWALDVLLSIPAIVIALLMLAGLGNGVFVVGLAITVAAVPPITRLVRTVTIEAMTNEYVESAVARGESGLYIISREILPNLKSTIVADFTIRLGFAFMLYAALSFLGLGDSPPSPDWGVMISENRDGLSYQPLPVLVPAVATSFLSVGFAFLADNLARKR